MKIQCKKDWHLNGRLGFKDGNYYPVLETGIFNSLNTSNRILLETDQEVKGFLSWFWSGSEYFDVDSIFE